MNERIKQLAEKAGLEFDDSFVLEPEPIYYTSQKDLEKFAELIIRESIEVMVKNDYHGEWLGKKVKEHFGVKDE